MANLFPLPALPSVKKLAPRKGPDVVAAEAVHPDDMAIPGPGASESSSNEHGAIPAVVDGAGRAVVTVQPGVNAGPGHMGLVPVHTCGITHGAPGPQIVPAAARVSPAQHARPGRHVPGLRRQPPCALMVRWMAALVQGEKVVLRAPTWMRGNIRYVSVSLGPTHSVPYKLSHKSAAAHVQIAVKQ